MKTILATIVSLLGIIAFAFSSGKKSIKNKQNEKTLKKVKRSKRIKKKISNLNDPDLVSHYNSLLTDHPDR